MRSAPDIRQYLIACCFAEMWPQAPSVRAIRGVESSQELREATADGSGHSGSVWSRPLEAPEQAPLERAEAGEVLDLLLGAARTDDQRLSTSE